MTKWPHEFGWNERMREQKKQQQRIGNKAQRAQDILPTTNFKSEWSINQKFRLKPEKKHRDSVRMKEERVGIERKMPSD